MKEASRGEEGQIGWRLEGVLAGAIETVGRGLGGLLKVVQGRTPAGGGGLELVEPWNSLWNPFLPRPLPDWLE